MPSRRALTIKDHRLRYQLANELHARPFPAMVAPGMAVFLAIKQEVQAVGRDRAVDLDHLIDLLERHGAPHPEAGATHYFGDIGKYQVKWEQHTEFVTYTIFGAGLGERAFDPAEFELFPEDWLASMAGVRMTSALIRIEPLSDDETIAARLRDWFVPESLAVSHVLDNAAVVASDFRIDPGGHLRIAMFVSPDTGRRRIGRVVQRLCEIETYKTMSMLGFSRAREMQSRMGEIDGNLTALMADMTSGVSAAEQTLDALLSISAELESLSAQSAFRFAATEAYQAIVGQRIEVLRERRFAGRQTFGEFMIRRYDPAMRTVKSTALRLSRMADRAMRAGQLLRTRVDVERSAQNQALLESMDKRAALQLRLQRTVEGLSVVAISYYAVSLAGYLGYPLAALVGVSKTMLSALITLPVVALVWMAVRRIRKNI
ncbi:MAG: DUF3422 domain-containing protein [Paracoccaceae bacterium]|nr:DUF3422 domain-containing protein [Paracoccaceae bacterium]